MKTERLVLLVTPDDKAALTRRAADLGISVSELVRQAASDYDPDEAAARAELEAYLPEFRATVDEIHATFGRMIAKLDEGERQRSYMETDAYREQVRERLRDDPDIDWDALRRLVGQGQAAA